MALNSVIDIDHTLSILFSVWVMSQLLAHDQQKVFKRSIQCRSENHLKSASTTRALSTNITLNYFPLLFETWITCTTVLGRTITSSPKPSQFFKILLTHRAYANFSDKQNPSLLHFLVSNWCWLKKKRARILLAHLVTTTQFTHCSLM